MNKVIISKIILWDENDNTTDQIMDVFISCNRSDIESLRESMKRKHDKRVSFMYKEVY